MFSLFANWKSHHSLTSAREWVLTFLEAIQPDAIKALEDRQLELVIFPPAPLLLPVKQLLQGYPVAVGAQDVSPHPEGKYTGEIAAETLAGIASHVICGHIEERLRGDTDDAVRAKVARLHSQSIIPLLCISRPDQLITTVSHLAYEPPEAVGTGTIASLTDITTFREKVDSLMGHPYRFIYGGSVDQTHAVDYMRGGVIDGYLIGTASLHGPTFAHLVNSLAT